MASTQGHVLLAEELTSSPHSTGVRSAVPSVLPPHSTDSPRVGKEQGQLNPAGLVFHSKVFKKINPNYRAITQPLDLVWMETTVPKTVAACDHSYL